MEYFSSSSSSPSFNKPLSKPPICDTAAAAADTDTVSGERERMFEKVVTPSDVGKLNRLVIPKQHAEKYFPLDSAAGEKGLLLNFEECRSSGKSWRFRYSYWSSSQSYVITKGWSRFVKDKKLDAGDVVSFSRSFTSDSVTARLFIDWCRRRRPDQTLARTIPWYYNYPHQSYNNYNLPSPAILMGVSPNNFPPLAPPPIHHRSYGGGFGANYNYGVISQNSCLHHGSVVSFEARGEVGSLARARPMVFESTPVANEKAAPKRLRLFGVNMDCTQEQEQEQQGEENCSLQLSLQGGDPSSSANFLSKGKSSMLLDFGV